METKSLFYKDMLEYEIEIYKQVTAMIQNIHISEEAAKRLNRVIDICVMQESLPNVDSKGDKENNG